MHEIYAIFLKSVVHFLEFKSHMQQISLIKSIKISHFIISILKSLVIPAIWLALSGVIIIHGSHNFCSKWRLF